MLEDFRKTIEATIGELTPARAKSLAKSLAGPGAAKEQVARSASDLIDWSQKNADRIKEFVRREVSSQVGAMGIATQAELELLKKRVRTLERSAEKPSGAAAKAAGKKTGTAAKSGARKTGAAPTASAKRTGGSTRARG